MTDATCDWDAELPPETEEEVYGNLVRALRRKEGFGLFFVQCSSAQGREIAAKLRRDLAPQRIEELVFTTEITTLYDRVAVLWQAQPFDVLLIQGLEASLYAYEDTKRFSGWSSEDIYQYSWKGVPKLLSHLNQRREQFRNDFPARFVFFAPPFVVSYFIQRAADFIDWRSGLFCFPRDLDEILEDVDQFLTKESIDTYHALSSQERTEKILALKDLKELCPDSNRQVSLLIEMGLLFASEKDYKNAISSYYQALKIRPDYYYLWVNLGLSLHKLDRYEEALTCYERVLQLQPNTYYAWHYRGLALESLGRYEEAISNYDKALDIKSDEDGIWDDRGRLLKNLGRYEDAIASFDKALDINPNNHKAWTNRGISFHFTRRYKEAVYSYDQALKISSSDHCNWMNRGIALHKLGYYEEAVASYDKALNIQADDG